MRGSQARDACDQVQAVTGIYLPYHDRLYRICGNRQVPPLRKLHEPACPELKGGESIHRTSNRIRVFPVPIPVPIAICPGPVSRTIMDTGPGLL